MKKQYKVLSMSIAEIKSGGALLSGSLTTKSITIDKEDVSVAEMKQDNAFEENGFGNVSF